MSPSSRAGGYAGDWLAWNWDSSSPPHTPNQTNDGLVKVFDVRRMEESGVIVGFFTSGSAVPQTLKLPEALSMPCMWMPLCRCEP